MAFDAAITTHRGVVVAQGGAVSASQPLAVSAGLNALQQGGTFADAALAASAVLCVVEPQSSHLGGDGFLIVYDAARRETIAFNGSGAAPQSAVSETYSDGIPVWGARSATVPGLVSTWFALHERYGRLPVADLLAPAIGYAESGFPAGPRFVRTCQNYAATIRANPSLAALGCRTDREIGDKVTQTDLAWTLKQIAAGGREAFYQGAVAARMAEASEGHFSLHDFAAHQTRTLPPLTARFRDLVVHGQPPPSQGHILLQELQIADGFDLAAMDEATRTHVLVEAKKLAFADRHAYLADPEHAEVPMEELLSLRYAARRRALIDLGKAANEYDAGSLDEGADTTYFLVSDREGNAVSFIQSIFHVYGSGTVLDGTGVLLNNRLTGFSLDETHPNFLAPGKRPAHTLNAWLATRDGQLAFVGGTPGANVQVQTNLQLLVNLVDGGMNPQAAIEAPRWQHQSASEAGQESSGGSGLLEIEDRVNASVQNDLMQRGHVVEAIGPWAHGSAAQVLQVLPGGAAAVGSDPRTDGHAAGI